MIFALDNSPAPSTRLRRAAKALREVCDRCEEIFARDEDWTLDPDTSDNLKCLFGILLDEMSAGLDEITA